MTNGFASFPFARRTRQGNGSFSMLAKSFSQGLRFVYIAAKNEAFDAFGVTAIQISII